MNRNIILAEDQTRTLFLPTTTFLKLLSFAHQLPIEVVIQQTQTIE